MKDNILIVPDVHGRTFWRKSTSNIDRYGKVIFLGDYLDPYHEHYDKIQTSAFCDWLNEHIHHEVPGILADIGRSRGGYQNHGSIVWANVSEHHTAPIGYAYQIFGHTQSQEPTITEHYACLDCHKPYILLPNGLITPYLDDH